MAKLVPISGKKLCKVLKKKGFKMIHGKGSHFRFKHSDGRRTVVPVHGNEDIGKGLLSAILRQTKISKEEFDTLRHQV